MGQIISTPRGNVSFPDDMSRKDIQSVLDKEFAPKKPKEEMGPFEAGYQGARADLSTAGAKVADTLGFPETGADWLKGAEERRKRVAESYHPEVPSYTDIYKPNDILGTIKRGAQYGYEGIAESAPQMAALAAAGTAGALAAPAGIPAALAGLGAAAVADVPFFTGSNLKAQMETGKSLKDTNLGTAAGAAVPQALLDVALGEVLPGVGRAVAGRMLTRAAKKAVEGMAIEGVSEGLQQAIEIGQADPTKLFSMSPEVQKELLEAAIKGGFLGGATGAGGGAFQKRQAAKPPGGLPPAEQSSSIEGEYEPSPGVGLPDVTGPPEAPYYPDRTGLPFQYEPNPNGTGFYDPNVPKPGPAPWDPQGTGLPGPQDQTPWQPDPSALGLPEPPAYGPMGTWEPQGTGLPEDITQRPPQTQRPFKPDPSVMFPEEVWNPDNAKGYMPYQRTPAPEVTPPGANPLIEPTGEAIKGGPKNWKPDAVKELVIAKAAPPEIAKVKPSMKAKRTGEAVHNDVRDQLIAAGKTPVEANAGAKIVRAFYEKLGTRLGRDAFDVYKDRRLRIEAAGLETDEGGSQNRKLGPAAMPDPSAPDGGLPPMSPIPKGLSDIDAGRVRRLDERIKRLAESRAMWAGHAASAPVLAGRANHVANAFRSNVESTERQIQENLAEREKIIADHTGNTLGQTFDQRVYHGTPNDTPFKRFMSKFLSSGEGVQAFGHGHYFTDNKELAQKVYREKLAKQHVITVDGKPTTFDGLWTSIDGNETDLDTRELLLLIKDYGGVNNASSGLADTVLEANRQMKAIEAKDNFDPNFVSRDYEMLENAKNNAYKLLQNLHAFTKKHKIESRQRAKEGRLYHVDIPDDGYIHYDKKMKDQPDILQKLAENLVGGHKYPTKESVRRDLADRTGEETYGLLADKLGSEAMASAVLNDIGIPGIQFYEGRSREKGREADRAREILAAEKAGLAKLQPSYRSTLQRMAKFKPSHNYVIFSDDTPQIVSYEQKKGIKRGDITFGSKMTVIRLMQNSDASTFMHESAHLFLEEMRHYSKHSGAVAQDMAEILQWLGAKNVESLTVAQHEKFARGFELYLREGKAPSKGLAAVFKQFAQWLTKVYADAKSLKVEVPDNIKRVYDRMLAQTEGLESSSPKGVEPASRFSDADRQAVLPNKGRSWVYTSAKAYGLNKSQVDAILAEDAKNKRPAPRSRPFDVSDDEEYDAGPMPPMDRDTFSQHGLPDSDLAQRQITHHLRELKRNVDVTFDPDLDQLNRVKHRAFMSRDGRIVAAWPAHMITHAELGDYHGRSLPDITPLTNIRNSVVLHPPLRGETEWKVGSDNLADSRPVSKKEYLRKNADMMEAYPPVRGPLSPKERTFDQSGVDDESLAARVKNSAYSKAKSFGRGLLYLDKTLNPMGNLPEWEQLQTKRQLATGKVGLGSDEGKKAFQLLSKLSVSDQKATYAYLTTRDASPSMVPGLVRPGVVAIKKRIEQLGQQLVDRGVLNPETFEANKGEYLPNVYMKYILEHAGITSTGMRPNLNEVKKRDDLTAAQRAALGQIEHPAVLTQQALTRMVRDIAMLDYLKEVSGNQKWAHPRSIIMFDGQRVTPEWLMAEASDIRTTRAEAMEKNDPAGALAMRDEAARMEQAASRALQERGQAEYDPKVWTQLPDTRQYGMLRGAWVRREVADDITGAVDFVRHQSMIAKALGDKNSWLVKAVQMWKISKVPLNPASQARNFIGNIMQSHLFGGIPLHKLPGALTNAIRDLRSDGPYTQIAKKYGLFHSTMGEVELHELSNIISQGLDPAGAHPLGVMKAGYLFSRGLHKATNLYQRSEELFKTAILRHAMETGMPEEQAARLADDAVYDYTLVHPSVKWMRNSALGMPFITWQYKTMGALAKTVREHPTRFLPYVAFMATAPMIAASMAGLKGDDPDRLRKALSENLRRQNNMFLLPYKDANGHWVFMDLGFFFPWQMPQDLATSLGRGDVKDAWKALNLFSNPVINVIQAMNTGIDPFTQRPIADKRDPVGQQVADIMGYVWSLAMPSVLAGYGAAGKLIDKETGTGLNRNGEPMNTYKEIAGRLVGINTYPVNPEAQRARNLLHMKSDIQQVKSRMTYEMKDQSLTPEQRMGRARSYQEKIKDMTEDMVKYARESAVTPSLAAASRP